MPGVFPPGRPRLSEQEIAENHRLRILYAAARLAEEKGYTETTVTDITKLARVDGRAFYRLFSDKQDAFSAVHELGFQQVMDVTAKAYFSGESWPERSWEGGRALTQLLRAKPAGRPRRLRRGLRGRPRGGAARSRTATPRSCSSCRKGSSSARTHEPVSRVAMEAIIAGVFEIIYLRTRARGEPKLAAMLPQIAHLWLAPFLGEQQSDALIDRKMEDVKPAGPARKR